MPSSLTLANKGQGKGLRQLLPVPTSESLGSGLPVWHRATGENGASFMKSSDPWDRLLVPPSFWSQTHWCPLSYHLLCLGARPLSAAAMNQAFWRAYKSKVLQTLGGESEEDLAEEVGTGHVF